MFEICKTTENLRWHIESFTRGDKGHEKSESQFMERTQSNSNTRFDQIRPNRVQKRIAQFQAKKKSLEKTSDCFKRKIQNYSLGIPKFLGKFGTIPKIKQQTSKIIVSKSPQQIVPILNQGHNILKKYPKTEDIAEDILPKSRLKKLKKDLRSKNRNNLKPARSIIIFLQYLQQVLQSFYHLMCKITFSHIIEENALRKGIFQLNDDQETFFNSQHDLSSEHSSEEESCDQSLEEIKLKRNEQIQTEIQQWFLKRMIFSGNPEDLIYKHVERQKTIILPKKSEVLGLSGNKVRMNNLLSRRTVKLLEVNVSG